MALALFALAFCGTLARSASAGRFLIYCGDLFAKIEGAMGAEATSGRIGAMEAALRLMYAAVPKSRQGRLDAVRYICPAPFLRAAARLARRWP